MFLQRNYQSKLTRVPFLGTLGFFDSNYLLSKSTELKPPFNTPHLFPNLDSTGFTGKQRQLDLGWSDGENRDVRLSYEKSYLLAIARTRTSEQC
ncbi:hypothetical protein CROQUDRAFT_658110 [Cronartium quercuum f. sp. fusiforme G11]|uniref:Uncharacterized protein n=1 Tax=Cronartium quercuum f. sp. fusiforme G11 TaxID=708437 RepID=A0A9P6NH44_9BASI|nr:hypothetical protein CROQUDRAFT_658110 [Cronartium quercuum f. sp. fusiforme G11]